MSSSIYNVPAWAATTVYRANDIVTNGSYYYYAKSNHTSGGSFDSSLWDGTISDNGVTKPYFFWRPSYDVEVLNEPKIKLMKFGDGYEQRLQDGINNNLLSISVPFDKLTLDQVTAISHFLSVRNARESFIFFAPQPFYRQARFVCRSWPIRYIFRDNYNIQCRFEEVVN